MDLFELLVYGFMFGAFLLFNFVSQQAARRRRQENAEQARVLMEQQEQEQSKPTLLRTGESGQPVEVDLAEESWGRAPENPPRSLEDRSRMPEPWGRASETTPWPPTGSESVPPPWARPAEGAAPVPEPVWRRPEPIASPERPKPFSYDTAAVLMREGLAASRPPAAPAPVRRPPQASGRSRRFNRPALHTRQGLRDAVVAMTILGPCRALQPYEDPAVTGGPERRPR